MPHCENAEQAMRPEFIIVLDRPSEKDLGSGRELYNRCTRLESCSCVPRTASQTLAIVCEVCAELVPGLAVGS